MDEDDNFLSQVIAGIEEAETISLFFPLLRRALVVDTRHSAESPHFIRVLPQARTMEERIRSIEALRPEFGKVRSILGVPWIKSVRRLDDWGITAQLVDRLAASGMPRSAAQRQVMDAIDQLWKLESIASIRMIKGEGYKTIWSAR